MERKEIENKFRQIISENTVVEALDVQLNVETDFVNDFGFDSLTTIMLIADIEKKFDIEFDIEELISDVIGKYGTLLNKIIEKNQSKEKLNG